jgi:hypothetical protein
MNSTTYVVSIDVPVQAKSAICGNVSAKVDSYVVCVFQPTPSDGVWLDVRADISTRGGMDDLISAIEANKPMLRRGAMREVAVADWPTIDGAEPE